VGRGGHQQEGLQVGRADLHPGDPLDAVAAPPGDERHGTGAEGGTWGDNLGCRAECRGHKKQWIPAGLSADFSGPGEGCRVGVQKGM
jgi:hypothetical protein